eukprot:TRINITY_DN9944_c0_g1_i1.p1 TRINITY_DN9944_c0_g1~~TRINITY_DN9944_c0_g1_i1.p1  ORF type:complete len:303 (-),score=42.30 TRINITY_DN9944_c0_g1_i1:67-975(-)
MSLDKETYEQLGLVGEKSSTPSTATRFFVKVDLTAPWFRPGKKNYERVQWCLSERTAPVQMLVSWYVDGEYKEIQFPEGVTWKRLALQEVRQTYQHIQLPVFDALASCTPITTTTPPTPTTVTTATTVMKSQKTPTLRDEKRIKKEQTEDMKLRLFEAFDWLGMLFLGAKEIISPTSTLQDPLVSSLSYETLSFFPTSLPDHNLSIHAQKDRGRGYLFRWEGLVAAQLILDHLVTKARALVRDGWAPWVAVRVLGFEDTPLSWGLAHQHGYRHSGENDYVLVVLPHDAYVLYLSVSSYDTFT